MVNSLLEVRVDRLERVLQRLCALAIELADGATQLGDGVFHVGLLGVQSGRLYAERCNSSSAPKIDAPKPLAVGFEARHLALDVGERRQIGAGLQLGQCKAAFRRDAEGFADLPRHILTSRGAPSQPRFGARASLRVLRRRPLAPRAVPARRLSSAVSASASASAATCR